MHGGIYRCTGIYFFKSARTLRGHCADVARTLRGRCTAANEIPDVYSSGTASKTTSSVK